MKKLLALLCVTLLLTGCYEELDWREWHAEDRSFTLMFPDKPRAITGTTKVGETLLQLHMQSVEIEGMAFGAAYADLAAGTSLNLVKDARDALVRNIEGRILSAKLIEVNGAKGMEFLAEGRSGETPMLMAARVLRDEKRFYQIVFVGRQERAKEVDIPFFLESFRPLR